MGSVCEMPRAVAGYIVGAQHLLPLLLVSVLIPLSAPCRQDSVVMTGTLYPMGDLVTYLLFLQVSWRQQVLELPHKP